MGINKDTSAGPSPSADLVMNSDEIRRLGYRIVDMIADELADPAQRSVHPPPQSPAVMEAEFGGPLPEEPMDPDAILDMIRDKLIPATVNYNHPRMMSYVSSASLTLPGLVEGLVASLKLFPYSWALTPGSTQIELSVGRWLGAAAGFSDTAAGYMTTGGTGANLMALIAARVDKTDWDVGAEGITGHAQLRAYASDQTHKCLDQAFSMMGMGRSALRKIGTDAEFRVRPDLLEVAIQKDIAEGHKPFCIIGSAGTTNTGSVDDLEALADLAKQYGLWFHVDGAYGALAALSPRARPLFAGIERADSLVVDPHKWMNVPYEAGCLLVKSWDKLSNTFSLVHEYMRNTDTEAAHDHWHHGWELTRGDRALKVWVALKQYGASGFRKMIEGHLDMAGRLAAVVEASDDLELLTRPSLSIFCFRYVPPDLRNAPLDDGYLNRLNEEIESQIQSGGDGLITGTDLAGKRCFRPCFVNYRLTQDGTDMIMAQLRETALHVDAQMRGGAE